VVALLFIGPTLWGAGAYLLLYGKVTDPMQKRRILLVGLSILLWFGTGLGANFGGIDSSAWWPVASRTIALLAAGTIYYAYAGLKPHTPQPEEATPSEAPRIGVDPLGPRRRVAHA